MSFITRFALDNTRLTIVFIASVLLIGLSQFFHFPRQEDPPITIREIVVVAFYPGMKPADVEELITRKLEAQIRTLPEIDDIWSDSKSGTCIIHAETRDEYNDLDTIWQKVRNKMIDIQTELPSGTIGPFVNDEFGLTAVATMALWADGFSMAEMRAGGARYPRQVVRAQRGSKGGAVRRAGRAGLFKVLRFNTIAVRHQPGRD